MSEDNSDDEIESDTNSEYRSLDNDKDDIIRDDISNNREETKQQEEDNKLEEITEQDELQSQVSDFSYLPQVKWLLYPDDNDDDVIEIDHKLESLQVKGK